MKVFVVTDPLHEAVDSVFSTEADAQERCTAMNVPRKATGDGSYLFEYEEFFVNTPESIHETDKPLIMGSS